MRAIRWTAALAVIAVVALPAFGQGGPGRCQGMPRYDGETEVSLEGVVERVRMHSCAQGRVGLHVDLIVGEERLDVHLGPKETMEAMGVELAEDQEITVVGSRFEYEGAPALIARSITSGDSVWTLRGEDGRPVWAGRGRGSARR